MFGIAFDILAIYGLILVAVVLFISKRIPFDVASLLIMAVLMISGILTPKEGLSGFSSPATITIASMFILSEGLKNTGALQIVANHLLKLDEFKDWISIGLLMTIIAVISAFINNTAAVAMFIPITIQLAESMDMSASKLLMPLSFAAMLGGVCTLIGTSTNLLVDSIAIENGLAGFGMFDFSLMGIIFVVTGFLYILSLGKKLIPERRHNDDLTQNYEMDAFITEITLNRDSSYIGSAVNELQIFTDNNVQVIDVIDEDGKSKSSPSQPILHENDTIRVRGGASDINELLKEQEVKIRPGEEWVDSDFEIGNARLIEAVIAPESPLEGKKLGDINFVDEYGVILLALRQNGSITNEDFEEIPLKSGSSLLLYTEDEKVQKINRKDEFVLASKMDLPHYAYKKIPVAVSIIGMVVLSAAVGLLPIVESAIAGVILMILSGCISTTEAYRSVNWKVIFLLAGVLPLGVAMQKTGAAQLMVDVIIEQFQDLGPLAILSSFFFLSMMFTNLISNQATAALLAPIAIEASNSIGVNAEPMLVAITMAASLSFMSPIGYQTNTMIYGPGQYRFTDYVKVGTPLNIVFWILGSVFIPMIWSF